MDEAQKVTPSKAVRLLRRNLHNSWVAILRGDLAEVALLDDEMHELRERCLRSGIDLKLVLNRACNGNATWQRHAKRGIACIS